MANEYRDLEGRLDDLLDSTENIRKEIKRENAKHDVRIRTNRRAVFAAILVAVLGVLVGTGGLSAAHDANGAATHANKAAQVAQMANVKTNQILSTSRKASCDSAAASTTKTRQGQKDQIRVLVGALLAANHTPATPELTVAVNRFYVRYDKTVDKDNPVRDCTPRGIACFLKLAPPAGAKACDGYDGYLVVQS